MGGLFVGVKKEKDKPFFLPIKLFPENISLLTKCMFF